MKTRERIKINESKHAGQAECGRRPELKRRSVRAGERGAVQSRAAAGDGNEHVRRKSERANEQARTEAQRRSYKHKANECKSKQASMEMKDMSGRGPTQPRTETAKNQSGRVGTRCRHHWSCRSGRAFDRPYVRFGRAAPGDRAEWAEPGDRADGGRCERAHAEGVRAEVADREGAEPRMSVQGCRHTG